MDSLAEVRGGVRAHISECFSNGCPSDLMRKFVNNVYIQQKEQQSVQLSVCSLVFVFSAKVGVYLIGTKDSRWTLLNG